MAIALPIIAPAMVSPGKCAPNKTRDSPAPHAHPYRVRKGPSKTMPVMVAKQNAAEVCSKGKLKRSDDTTSALKLGMIACGR